MLACHTVLSLHRPACPDLCRACPGGQWAHMTIHGQRSSVTVCQNFNRDRYFDVGGILGKSEVPTCVMTFVRGTGGIRGVLEEEPRIEGGTGDIV